MTNRLLGRKQFVLDVLHPGKANVSKVRPARPPACMPLPLLHGWCMLRCCSTVEVQLLERAARSKRQPHECKWQRQRRQLGLGGTAWRRERRHAGRASGAHAASTSCQLTTLDWHAQHQ